MKRIVSYLLLIAVMFSGILVSASGEGEILLNEDGLRFAEATFDKDSDTLVNMSKFQAYGTTSGNAYTKVERNGKTGITRSNEDAYILFDVDDDYWYSDEPVNVAVTVEYFDEGNGFFTLRYTSENGGTATNPVEYGKNDIEWDIVELSDTKQWKTHTFYMDDCLINGTGISGTDMAITLASAWNGTSSESVIFHSFRIDEIYMPVPNLSIDSGHAGNIFGRNDKPELDIVAQNRTNESINTAVSYTVKDSMGNVVKSGEYEAEIEPKGQHIQKIDTGMVKYGVYYLDVTTISTAEINGQQSVFENTETFHLSKILSTEKGESRNKKIRVNAHIDRYTDINIGLEQLAKAGFSGGRGGWYWSEIERTKGVFNLTETYEKIRAGYQRENLGLMCLLAYSNPNYITSSAYTITTLPYTDDEIAAYADYCAYMAREFKGVTNIFEVWNEPNITPFNTQNRSGADYARVLKAAYQAVKNENPDAIVYGCSTAGCDTAFISDVLKAGGGQYLDGITIHTYDYSGGFRQDQLIEKFQSVRELMKEYGIENKPIALSEMGWSDTMTTSNGGQGEITQQEQASYAVQLVTIANSLDYLDSIYWYTLKTIDLKKGSIEPGYGLTRSGKTDNPDAAKPAYVAFAAINRFLAGDSEFVSAVENDAGAVYRFKTENDENLAIVWSADSQATNLEVNLGHCKASVYDMYGNKLETLLSDDGIYTVLAEAEPKYLISDYDISPTTFSAVSAAINCETREVTVKGEIANRNIGEEMTVIAIPEGISPDENPEQIVYVNQVEINSKSFEHIFTLSSSSTSKCFDIYLGGNYVDKIETDSVEYVTFYDNAPSTFSAVSTTINHETREVTVKGEIVNRNIGEEMTVIAIPKGISPNENPEQIVYINQAEVNSKSFEHIFTVPSSSTAESFDIYLCGNYVDKIHIDSVEYLSLKVATLDFTGTETQLTAAAYVSNHLSTDKDITIMIAQYENGVLKKVDAAKRTVSNNTNNVSVSLTVEKADGATSYKAFVVDSVDNIKPLCGAKEIF